MGKAAAKRVSRAAKGVAAVGVAAAVAGVAATQPSSISAPLVDLRALIVVGSSTHPDGSGNENFYHGLFNAPPFNTTGDDLTHVNFFTGPFGINQAVAAHAGETNAVLASGWGAANASLLLTQLQAQKSPVLPQSVFVLDNNVARPNGGFGTRYPWFALIGVNPFPSPTTTDALGVVDVGYEYDYNSDAPADVLNPVAAVNSLVAYLYGHLNQANLDLPVNPDGSPAVSCGTANTCGVTASGDVLACPDAQCGSVPAGDRVAEYVTQRGNTTYVTYTSNGLPLTNLIRAVVPFGVGNTIADLTEPVLTEIVNAAYPNGNPIPADPSKYQPATPFSSVLQLAAKLPSAIQQGITAAASKPSQAKTTATVYEDPKPTVKTKSVTAKKPKVSDSVADHGKPSKDASQDSPASTAKGDGA